MKNFMIKWIMIIFLSLCVLIFIASIFYNKSNADYYNEVKFGKYNQAIIVYDKQVDTLVELWYDTKRIIDLLTLKSMECNSYKWDCIWLYNPDIWHFQINSIHKIVYKESRKLFKAEKWSELFIYQVKYVNGMLDWYNKNNCSKDSFDTIWKEYNNKERFKCFARSYNWWIKKKSYAQLAWIKREFIREYIINYLK